MPTSSWLTSLGARGLLTLPEQGHVSRCAASVRRAHPKSSGSVPQTRLSNAIHSHHAETRDVREQPRRSSLFLPALWEQSSPEVAHLDTHNEPLPDEQDSSSNFLQKPFPYQSALAHTAVDRSLDPIHETRSSVLARTRRPQER